MVVGKYATRALLLVAGLLAASPAWAIEEKLLPANAEIIFSINIKQILDSEVVKAQKTTIDQVRAALQGQIPGDDQAKKYLDKLGFDPFRDLHGLTVTHTGSKDPDALFVVVQGSFDPKKFETTAVEAAKDNGDALRISNLGEVKVFEISPPGDKKFYVSVLDTKSLVLTLNQNALKEVVGRATGAGTGGLKKEIRDLLKTTNEKQSVSLVITGAALGRVAENAPNIPNAEQAGQVLQAIEGISAAVTIAKNINFQLGVGFRDEPTTKKLVAGSNAGLLGLRIFAAQKAKENPDLMPLIDVMNTLRVGAVGTSLVLTGEVSYDNLDKLIKSFNKLKQP